MVSTSVMLLLIVEYLVIAGASLCECPRNWWRAVYFIGAALITVAVLGMTREDGAIG